MRMPESPPSAFEPSCVTSMITAVAQRAALIALPMMIAMRWLFGDCEPVFRLTEPSVAQTMRLMPAAISGTNNSSAGCP